MKNLLRIISKIISVILDRLRRLRPLPYTRSLGVTIGEDVRFSSATKFGSEPWLITLGSHILISDEVQFVTHDGGTSVFNKQERYKDVIRYGKIEIKDNCFIGARATILPGVTIGPYSVVGAGSVVTKDVPPNTVYAGVPAHFIKTTDDYAEMCLNETPDYDKVAYHTDKRTEVLRFLSKK